MREIVQIVNAFEKLAGAPAALATVVGVEGSSYRQPGARMLITSDGRTFGGVSGGCLESDVARRGRIVIDSGEPQVSVYETADDVEENSPGASLGCGGRIEILIQRVDASRPGVLAAMIAAVRGRKVCRAATIIRSSGAVSGSGIIFIGDQPAICDISDGELSAFIARELNGASGEARNIRLARADFLIESILPPQSLFIYGGGGDVPPMVEMAKSLGWHVTVVSSRGTFAGVDVLSNETISPSGDAAAIIMNHNLRRDIAALRAAVSGECRYIGILGPRRRSLKMLESLGNIDSEMRQRIFAPVGLDIGAQTPEQIALAVLAEISAVISSRAGGPLRQRTGPIHETSGRL